jgi:uncharacterized protein with GYD domain
LYLQVADLEKPRSIAAAGDRRDTAGQAKIARVGAAMEGIAMAKYMFLFGLTGETVKRFVAQPSDRAAVVRELVESAGGTMESYYWMFGQYDGLVIFEMPDSKAVAALSLAVTGSGAFTKFETHELIEASDLGQIAERARQISYRPPGA